MNDNLNKILEEYQNQFLLYSSFGNEIEKILTKLLKNISIHQVTSRVKTHQSLIQKIEKKNKYSSLEEITDILGVRIITYFEDDILKIEQIIHKEFKIDIENSIDKKNIEIDRFGYRSVHSILQIDDLRSQVTEYAEYKNIKFEIQIRSILQHSWAEIEHDLGYKSLTGISDQAKRSFCRVAALLELADVEFGKLRTEILEFEYSVGENLKDNNKYIGINDSTIIAFVKNSKLLREIENEITQKLALSESSKFDPEYISLNNLPRQLKNLKICDLNQLEDSLVNNRVVLINNHLDYVKSLYEKLGDRKFSLIQGAPIIWLINYLETD